MARRGGQHRQDADSRGTASATNASLVVTGVARPGREDKGGTGWPSCSRCEVGLTSLEEVEEGCSKACSPHTEDGLTASL